jgi:hypothetical protein
MNTLLSILIILAGIAVLASLVLGLIGMVKEGTPDKKQNKMMQMRVGFQFIALILLGITFAIR